MLDFSLIGYLLTIATPPSSATVDDSYLQFCPTLIENDRVQVFDKDILFTLLNNLSDAPLSNASLNITTSLFLI